MDDPEIRAYVERTLAKAYPGKEIVTPGKKGREVPALKLRDPETLHKLSEDERKERRVKNRRKRRKSSGGLPGASAGIQKAKAERRAKRKAKKHA